VRVQRIEHPVDAIAARRAAVELARKIGFDDRAIAELAIVTSELASNIAKYGVRGAITLEQITHPMHGPGLAILAADEGPPFHDFELAKRDGFDDRGPVAPETLLLRRGLGTGLGAVTRLTDELALEPCENGKRLRAVRYKCRPPRGS
jgi:anti-sigma regulatory factor (Ser/Thr protein kinase)